MRAVSPGQIQVDWKMEGRTRDTTTISAENAWRSKQVFDGICQAMAAGKLPVDAIEVTVQDVRSSIEIPMEVALIRYQVNFGGQPIDLENDPLAQLVALGVSEHEAGLLLADLGLPGHRESHAASGSGGSSANQPCSTTSFELEAEFELNVTVGSKGVKVKAKAKVCGTGESVVKDFQRLIDALKEIMA